MFNYEEISMEEKIKRLYIKEKEMRQRKNLNACENSLLALFEDNPRRFKLCSYIRYLGPSWYLLDRETGFKFFSIFLDNTSFPKDGITYDGFKAIKGIITRYYEERKYRFEVEIPKKKFLKLYCKCEGGE